MMDETDMETERWFARMGALSDGSWTVNFMVLKDGTATQHTAGPGGQRDAQSADCSWFDYNPKTRRLQFRPGQTTETLDGMWEVEPGVGHTILKDHNWTNLLRGLASKSERTKKWLEDRNIRP